MSIFQILTPWHVTRGWNFTRLTIVVGNQNQNLDTKKSWSLKQKFARSHKAGDFPQMPHFTQNCVPILTKFSPHRMWLQGKFLSLNNISSNNEHSNANVLKYQCVLSDKQKLEEATSEP